MLSRLLVPAEEEALPVKLAVIEKQIAREYSRRVHHFHIALQQNGLILEGRTRTYFTKQAIQESVFSATALVILANNISVDIDKIEMQINKACHSLSMIVCCIGATALFAIQSC
jgi:hypothetical protein